MMSDPTFWAGQSVIVTGGAGFLGRHVVEGLHKRGAKRVFVVRSADYDLRHEEDVRRLYRDVPATLVIHLAASVGGIGANRKHPGSFFYNSLMMGTLMLEYARLNNVPKFVGIGTICAIPSTRPSPSARKTSGTAIPKRLTRPTAWRRRCC